MLIIHEQAVEDFVLRVLNWVISDVKDQKIFIVSIGQRLGHFVQCPCIDIAVLQNKFLHRFILIDQVAEILHLSLLP